MKCSLGSRRFSKSKYARKMLAADETPVRCIIHLVYIDLTLFQFKLRLMSVSWFNLSFCHHWRGNSFSDGALVSDERMAAVYVILCIWESPNWRPEDVSVPSSGSMLQGTSKGNIEGA